MTERIDALVVGAGVIGLAVARALARAGREVVVLERERAVGQHASSRNSEVIHAGIYYPPNSLKARLCLEGRDALYRYCGARGVAHRRVGKLIVATTEAQRPTLERLRARAHHNGVDDLRPVDAAEIRRREPAVFACAALWSPSTGIIDSHGLMRALWSDAERRGAALALDTTLTAASPEAGGLLVDAGDTTLRCALLVNAAGLGAQSVARAVRGLPPSAIPRRHLLKGSYFSLAGASPFSHLIYPVPDTASLGIHVTVDLAGRARFGPDQQWVETVDYSLDPGRASAFSEAIRAYYPGLDPDALTPDYAGIRAKIQGPAEPPVDFMIQGPGEHGIDGLVNLFGIESPGLTASLALADEVLRRLGVTPAPE